jgi:hypothetical protein
MCGRGRKKEGRKEKGGRRTKHRATRRVLILILEAD